MPPWVDERPASAPGGMGYRFSWEVMQTTLLSWDKDMMQVLGPEVQKELQVAIGQHAQLHGCVGQPTYSCVVLKWVDPHGQPLAAEHLDDAGKPKADVAATAHQLPCGKRALMNPALSLNRNANRWLCGECADSKHIEETRVGAANRVIMVWPLVDAKGKATVLRTKQPPVEFILESPPYDWQWPRLEHKPLDPGQVFTPTSCIPWMKRKVRFIFHGADSEGVWRCSSRYSPQTAPWQARANRRV